MIWPILAQEDADIDKKTTEESMLDATLALLDQAVSARTGTTQERLDQIAAGVAGTGKKMSAHWLAKMLHRRIPDPGIKRVEALKAYLETLREKESR